jgi:Ubiquitin-2 like Rad60 SUMO-like
MDLIRIMSDDESSSDGEPMISSPDSSDSKGTGEDAVFKFHAERFNKETVVHSGSSPSRRRGRSRKHCTSLEEQLHLQESKKQLKFEMIKTRVAKKMSRGSDDESNDENQRHKKVVSINHDSPTGASEKPAQGDIVNLLESSDEEDDNNNCSQDYKTMGSALSAEAAETFRKSRLAALQLQEAQHYHAEDIYVPVETPKGPEISAFQTIQQSEPAPKRRGKFIQITCRAVVLLNGKKQPEWKTNLTIREDEELRSLLDKFLNERALPTTTVITMTFDGETLDYNRTPRHYGIEDLDLIDVHAKSIIVSMQSVTNKMGPTLNLTIRERDGKQVMEHRFFLGKQQIIQDLFDKYQNHTNNKGKKCIFQFEGENLDPQKTPAAYDMENGDLIDVFCR